MLTLKNIRPILTTHLTRITAVGTSDGETKAIAERVGAAGSSFFWTMRFLPPPRRRAMYALYAFCREVDDIADGEASTQSKLTLLGGWRSRIAQLYARRPTDLLTRALIEPVDNYNLRCEDFHAIVDGMEMDARSDIQAPNLAELDLYCSRVAVAVGLLSVRIFGVETEAADRVAAELGRALQLTNILRDLDEDAERNRLYLPRELLRAHDIATITPRSVLSHPAVEYICRDLAAIAERHYADALEALAECPHCKMRPAALMLHSYRELLHLLVARGWSRLKKPVRIPAWRKAGLLVRYGFAGR